MNPENENPTTEPEVATTIPESGHDTESGQAADAQANASSESNGASATGAKTPRFENLVQSEANGNGSIQRFLDVKVNVSAQLGNIDVPIGDLLKLTEGSVLELNRSLGEPIELVAQGVRFATGEVVVIDDCFAVRVNEIEGNLEE